MSQFNSVYTTIKKPSDIRQSTTSNSISQVFDNKGGATDNAFAPSTSSKYLAKKDKQTSQQEEAEIKGKGITLFLTNSQAIIPEQSSKLKLLQRRYKKLEDWLYKMRDPVDGVAFVNRKKLFDVSPASAPGFEITEWIFKNCGCQQREEAKRIFQIFLDHAYLIPLDVTVTTPEEDPEFYYSFQADYFYASRFWVPSDIDYGIHLLRRSGKTGGQLTLGKEEIEAFYKIQKEFDTKWKVIVQGSDKQKTYLHSLEKKDKRLLELREYAFWRVNRPVNGPQAVVQVLKDDEELKKKHFSEDEYFEQIKDADKKLEYANKKLNAQFLQDSLVRKEAGTAAKNLIKYVEMWTPMDPFIVNVTNPWCKEEPVADLSQENKPRQVHVHLWTNSFRDMMNDPIGVKYFARFLEKDHATESLMFYLSCQQLEAIQGREEYFNKAKEILKDFIEVGSPREINIDANMRNQITETINTSDFLTLPVDVFVPALEHCYQLMQTASYPRFCASEEIRDILAGFKKPANITRDRSFSSLKSAETTDSITYKVEKQRLSFTSERKVDNATRERFKDNRKSDSSNRVNNLKTSSSGRSTTDSGSMEAERRSSTASSASAATTASSRKDISTA